MFYIKRVKVVPGCSGQGIVTKDGRIVAWLEKGSRIGTISPTSLKEEDEIRSFINNSRIRRGVLWIDTTSVS